MRLDVSSFFYLSINRRPNVISSDGYLIKKNGEYLSGRKISSGLNPSYTWHFFLVSYIALNGTLFYYVYKLFRFILSTRFLPFTSRRKGPRTMPTTTTLKVPFQCTDMEGKLNSCDRSGSECFGTWKPPRTHHCSTCGVCRRGFDHHCPWLSENNMWFAEILLLMYNPYTYLGRFLYNNLNTSCIPPSTPAYSNPFYYVYISDYW